MEQTLWFSRPFPIQPDNGLLPAVLERLRGTPARLEEKLHDAAEERLERKTDGKWSVKEEIGHLSDLEPLWLRRILELRAGAPVLTAADLQNRKTHEADHNTRPVSTLLAQFRAERIRLLAEFDTLTDAEMETAALHPRLQTPMRALDLAFFVAEHDDHHLARITRLLR